MAAGIGDWGFGIGSAAGKDAGAERLSASFMRRTPLPNPTPTRGEGLLRFPLPLRESPPQRRRGRLFPRNQQGKSRSFAGATAPGRRVLKAWARSPLGVTVFACAKKVTIKRTPPSGALSRGPVRQKQQQKQQQEQNQKRLKIPRPLRERVPRRSGRGVLSVTKGKNDLVPREPAVSLSHLPTLISPPGWFLGRVARRAGRVVRRPSITRHPSIPNPQSPIPAVQP